MPDDFGSSLPVKRYHQFTIALIFDGDQRRSGKLCDEHDVVIGNDSTVYKYILDHLVVEPHVRQVKPRCCTDDSVDFPTYTERKITWTEGFKLLLDVRSKILFNRSRQLSSSMGVSVPRPELVTVQGLIPLCSYCP